MSNETWVEEVKRLIAEVRTDFDNLAQRLVKAERTLTHAGYQDLGGGVWKPLLGDLNKMIKCSQQEYELATLKEQYRRLDLFVRAHTNFIDINDLCEHGCETGCCLSCSRRGPTPA